MIGIGGLWLCYLLTLLLFMVVFSCLFSDRCYSTVANLFVASIVAGVVIIITAMATPYADLSSIEMMWYCILLLTIFLLPLALVCVILYTGWFGKIINRLDKNIKYCTGKLI